MKYTINGHELDSLKRTLMHEGKQQKVRPKTMDMLMFFISHQEQVIAKSRLLEEIWHDTTVNEGVVFQSINEIRKLFKNQNIIINHPRRGYQLNAEVKSDTDSANTANSNKVRNQYAMKWWLFSALAIVFTIALVLFSIQSKPSATYRVLIMPADSQIRYENTDWLSLGSMDYLIRRMRAYRSLYLFSVEEVLHFTSHIGSPTPTDTATVKSLFDHSNATHIVYVTVKGESPDFTLVLTVYDKNNSHSFVMLSESINHALEKASVELTEYFSLNGIPSSYEPEKAFKNSLFTRAILAYETDWDTSIHYLQSYLDVDVESTIAMQYLAKLMVWKNNIQEAEKLLDRLEIVTTSDSQDRAMVYYLRSLIALKSSNPTLALKLIKRANEVMQHHSHSLFTIRLLDSTAGVFMETGEVDKAITKFHTALRLYESVNNLVGINSVKLQLARAYNITGEQQLSYKYFHEAEQQISQLEITFLNEVLQETRASLYPKKNRELEGIEENL